MKQFWIIVCVLLVSVKMLANDSIAAPVRPNLLSSMEGVEVVQDSSVGRLLETAMFGKLELVEIDGYRVQIFSSNQQQTAKVQALNLESSLKDKLEQTVYVSYQPPFWKVRVGDFRTIDEAREYKKEFVQHYPEMMGDTYIVRDKIQVLQ